MTLDVEGLRNRFQLANAPYWTATNGRNGKEVLGRFTPEEYSNQEDKMLDSWMQLEELFRDYRSGYAKITCKRSEKENNMYATTMFVQWGDSDSATLGSTLQPRKTLSGMIPGFSIKDMFEMQQKQHEQQMEMMKEMLNYKHSLQNAEDVIEGMGEPDFKTAMIMKAMDILPAVIGGRSAQMGSAGFPNGNEIGPENSSAPTEDATQQVPVDLNQIHAAAQMVGAAVPQYSPNDVFGALALYCKSNPESAAQYIGMIIQEVKNSQNVVGKA